MTKASEFAASEVGTNRGAFVNDRNVFAGDKFIRFESFLLSFAEPANRAAPRRF